MGTRRTPRLLFTIAVTATLALIACGGGTDSTASVPPTPTVEPTATPEPSPTPEPTVEPSPTAVPTEPAEEATQGQVVGGRVKSVIFGQELDNLTVPVGTKITWLNDDVEDHDITSGTENERLDLFNSGVMREGDKFSLTFDVPGVYPYYCTIHPTAMQATITVIGEDGVEEVVADSTPDATATPVPPSEPTSTPEALPTATLEPARTPTTEPTATATTVPTATSTPTPTVAPEPTPTASPTPEPPPAAASAIQNFRLQNLSISVGTTVTWTNLDGATHTTTSGEPFNSSGVWDSPTLSPGNQFAFTFNQAGTFAYYCRIHPSMTGTVTVTE